MLYNLLANNKELFIKCIAERRFGLPNIESVKELLISSVSEKIKSLNVTEKYFGINKVNLSLDDMALIMWGYSIDCPIFNRNCKFSCNSCRKNSVTKLFDNNECLNTTIKRYREKYGT